jgi:hypothetical protein
MVIDANQLQTAAAKVASYALRFLETGNDTQSGVIGFFLA